MLLNWVISKHSATVPLHLQFITVILKSKINSIRLVDEHGNSITQPENLVGEKALGIEFTSGYAPYKWWKLDFNANFFYSEIDATNISPDYNTTTLAGLQDRLPDSCSRTILIYNSGRIMKHLSKRHRENEKDYSLPIFP